MSNYVTIPLKGSKIAMPNDIFISLFGDIILRAGEHDNTWAEVIGYGIYNLKSNNFEEMTELVLDLSPSVFTILNAAGLPIEYFSKRAEQIRQQQNNFDNFKHSVYKNL